MLPASSRSPRRTRDWRWTAPRPAIVMRWLGRRIRAEMMRRTQVRRLWEKWVGTHGKGLRTANEVLLFDGYMGENYDILRADNRVGSDSYQLLKSDLDGLWSDQPS